MSKPEGGRSKDVDYRGVDIWIVDIVVSVCTRPETKEVGVTATKDNGEVLVVSYMLHFRGNNFSCLLKEPFVVPLWVDLSEAISYIIMFS